MTEDLGELVRAHTILAWRRDRVPGLAVAVGRAGKVLHQELVGWADANASRRAEPETQFRLGSITKTFTAAAVLLLAEAGRLDLDEPVGTYLSGTAVSRARLRHLLAHCSGLQREVPVPMWATMKGPDAAELRSALARAETVDRPGARWHYSNLGYAVLGEVVAEVTGSPCERFIDAALIEPLGLHRTTWQPRAGAAVGYRLDPYQDSLHPEPVMDQGAIGVGGQLWSTLGDMTMWADALCGGAPSILPLTITEMMHTPHVMTDRQSWAQGWGLGLILDRRDHGILSGHTGAMPGFASALVMHRSTRTSVTAFANVTRGIKISGLATQVLEEVLSRLPVPVVEPRPSEVTRSAVPRELEAVLGRWWSEAEETVFIWRDGKLCAYLAASPALAPSIFVREGPDRYRAVEGRFEGERLLVERDPDGRVTELVWATYPFSRKPR
jgi:CubicO group peptidase (beta-lactamase class C family)